MSRKDFELIAGVLKEAKPDPAGSHFNHWGNLVIDFTNALDGSNPGFDRVRFIKACGLQRNEWPHELA